MAQTKNCNQCGKSLSTSEFYKKTKSKDGLQPTCKACCKIANAKFRETKPKYQVEWQRTNNKKWTKYIGEWNKINCKADNSRSVIYYIISPSQKIYVGHSQTRFYQRKSAHKKEYKLNKGAMPYLHQSFDDHGYDNHSWVVMDMSGMDKETLEIIEYAMANEFTKLGISLNKRLK
jgi:hypothetical protein